MNKLDPRDTAGSQFNKSISEGFDVVTVPGRGLKNFFITAYPGKNGTRQSVTQHVAEFAKEENATIVCQRVFSGRAAQPGGMPALGESVAHGSWPVTWLQGNDDCRGTSTCSHVYAIAGSPVTRVCLDGQIAGAVFEDEDAEYCFLAGLRPKDLAVSNFHQAESVFERIEAALQSAGMGVSQIVRTWFFIDKILDWYAGFNLVRTRFFMDHGLFDGVVPASTGIGVANAASAALVADVLAVKPKNRDLNMTPTRYKFNLRDVPSPLQCSATNYKSSFSRAVEIRLRGQRRLYVSGTASITPDGKTAHRGDVEKQIALTMEVVESILESRLMNWSNVTRGTVYFKDLENKPVFDLYCRENQLAYLPLVFSSADICRGDLLFEVEVDAVALK